MVEQIDPAGSRCERKRISPRRSDGSPRSGMTPPTDGWLPCVTRRHAEEGAMRASDTRLATAEAEAPEVPKWLRTIGIGLGVVLVPPIVIPIVLLVMALGMLAFLPFLPPLL